MLGKFFDKILEEDEREIEERDEKIKKQRKKRAFDWKEVFLPVFLFLLALGVRLAFLFTHDPQSPGLDWYGDVYHHWQIAYLSKVVGFKRGFLRLWDLKGMEYHWGLMHPLVLVFLFGLFKSVDIVIPRLLSIFCGSLVVVFIYFLAKRHFSWRSAIALGLWSSLFSVSLFSDTLGMQEQLGLAFLFGGLIAWPQWGFLSGIFWAFASMVRSEYWLFAIGLIFAALFDQKKRISEKKALMFLGYLFLIIFYIKYLVEYTGNPIYPIYWNYLASVIGRWFSNVSQPLTAEQIQAQWVGRSLFFLGLIGVLAVFLKRPRYYLFFLLGFFNVAFIGFIFGFAAYVHGFFSRFWVDRLFAFPYLFLGIVIILFFLEWLPNFFPQIKKLLIVFGGISFILILGVSQLAWGKIFYYFKIAQAPYSREKELASFIARYDRGGRILFPSNRPALTYALVYHHHITGERLLSEMYDPYFYAQGKETMAELEEKMIAWLSKEKIKLIVDSGKSEYKNLWASHPEHFKFLAQKEGINLYEFLQ